MPLLGPAAMLLSFDVLPPAVTEHDHWHTHEHLPERLSIPGFRGADAAVDWAVMISGYEQAALADPAALGLAAPPLEVHGACEVVEHALYRVDCTLAALEVGAAGERRC